MRCISCNGEVSVMETINQQRATYRQRRCNECGMKFYTKEEVCPSEEAQPLFAEWVRERQKKHRAKEKGINYEVSFADGREKSVAPKKPTSPLF